MLATRNIRPRTLLHFCDILSMVLMRDNAFVLSLNSDMMLHDSCFIIYLCVESALCTAQSCGLLLCYADSLLVLLLDWFSLIGLFRETVLVSDLTLSERE